MRYDKSRWSSPRTARFSVPLGPFERANRSARKKRNEFRSTAPRPRVLGKSQSWLMAAHQLASAYQFWRATRGGGGEWRENSGQGVERGQPGFPGARKWVAPSA